MVVFVSERSAAHVDFSPVEEFIFQIKIEIGVASVLHTAFVLPLCLATESNAQPAFQAVAVGQFHTSRRYLMTLERYWPGIEKMLVTAESHGIGRADWHRHPAFISLIRGEMARIEPYLARNIIAEIDPATCTLL